MAKAPFCPLTKKACAEHECAWYAHMEGINPQTGKPMDHWDCAVKWLPILITEQARQTRGVQASVESFRNEATKQQAELNEKMAGAANFMGMIDAVAKQRTALPGQNYGPVLTHVDKQGN